MNHALLLTTVAASLLLLTACHGQTPVNPDLSLAGGRSHFAAFGPNKVRYLTVGKGRRTIMLIHGWSCNSSVWREQIPALADKAQLLLIDLPGHGQSDKPQTDWWRNDQTSDLPSATAQLSFHGARYWRASSLLGVRCPSGVQASP